MFDTSRKYEILATVNGSQAICFLEHLRGEWTISCPSMTNTEGWSTLASTNLSIEALDTIQPHQESGQYFTSMKLKTDGENLKIV